MTRVASGELLEQHKKKKRDKSFVIPFYIECEIVFPFPLSLFLSWSQKKIIIILAFFCMYEYECVLGLRYY